jgi:hypothetical protein
VHGRTAETAKTTATAKTKAAFRENGNSNNKATTTTTAGVERVNACGRRWSAPDAKADGHSEQKNAQMLVIEALTVSSLS